jgi:hypothetical protein
MPYFDSTGGKQRKATVIATLGLVRFRLSIW